MGTSQPEDHGSAVNIVNWVFLVATLSTVLTRTLTRWAVTRKSEPADVAIMTASIFAIGQSTAISTEVSGGLGRHVHSLTAADKIKFQKSFYASGVLYIPGICLSKLAVLLLLRNITPIVSHRRKVFAVEVLTIGWALVTECVLIFQCQTPRPWAILQGHCINSAAFWYFVGIAQLLLDIVLVLLPWMIVRNVQMEMHRKIVIGCCFGTRLTVVIAVVAQLVYFHNATKSDDRTYNLWSVVICTQIVQSLSIISACVPYLKPVFDTLESGMMRNLRRRGQSQDHTYRRSYSRRPPFTTSAPVLGQPTAPATGHTKMGLSLPQEPVQAVLSPSNIDPTMLSSPKASAQVFQKELAPLPQRESSITSKPTASIGHDCDSDSQTSRIEILKEVHRPARANVPRFQPPR
ncbi:MAG: hypothetical protein Q9220_006933 [cf. Caloplaca sp. 1 TL-2023]